MRDLTITYVPGDGTEWQVSARSDTVEGITSVALAQERGL